MSTTLLAVGGCHRDWHNASVDRQANRDEVTGPEAGAEAGEDIPIEEPAVDLDAGSSAAAANTGADGDGAANSDGATDARADLGDAGSDADRADPPDGRAGCGPGQESNAAGGCRAVVDDCASNACQNGGKCIDGYDAYTCDCTGTGFEGSHCAVDVDECATPNLCNAAYPCKATDPPGYVCLGQFADWPMPARGAGAKFMPAYTADQDVVRDNVTGLIWQKVLPATNADPTGTYSGCTGKSVRDGDTCTWEQAKRYCTGLRIFQQDLTVGWRLPSKIELESLGTDVVGLSIADNSVFPSPPSEPFWTASPVAGVSGQAWAVPSVYAGTYALAVSSSARVRCVHAGQPFSPSRKARYVVDEGLDTVTDTRTQLVWQLTVTTATFTKAEGIAACARRGTGWRMPELKELQTLVDPTRVNPAADPASGKMPSARLWANSFPVSPGSSTIRVVNFADGAGASANIEEPLQLRCVR